MATDFGRKTNSKFPINTKASMKTTKRMGTGFSFGKTIINTRATSLTIKGRDTVKCTGPLERTTKDFGTKGFNREKELCLFQGLAC